MAKLPRFASAPGLSVYDTEEMTSPSVRAALLLALLFFAERGLAANIPDDVKKIVAFIFLADKDGKLRVDKHGDHVPYGTGFFAGVKNEVNPATLNGYFVTARHVLHDKAGKLYPRVWLRLNTVAGGAEFVPLDLTVKGRKTLYTHPTDETVDIVVIPVLPDRKRFDFKLLTDNFLTTKESVRELNIGEGSDVFFTGLFTPYIGKRRNHPIVRFGRVALLPDERIPWKDKPDKELELLELYLIETFSFGGNSGAPVFFYLGSDRSPGNLLPGMVLKFAGIVKGSFLDGYPVRLLETAKTLVSSSNVGISAVVPSYLLHDILFSHELKELRKSSRAPTN